MGQGKRKVLRFNEDDLEWINPLIKKWIKENKGKNQSDLIVQLLKDFKLRSESVSTEARAQREHKDKKDYIGEIRSRADPIVNRLQEKLHSGYKDIKSNTGKGVETLGNKFKNLKSSVNDLFSGLQLETKDVRVEMMKAEVERLQNMVDELVRAQDADTEELQSEARAAAS
jgi:hypothetical protein